MAEALESRRARRLAEVPMDSSMRLSWLARFRNLVIGRVAEAIVEWRLLWHLRKQSDAELVYPSDLDVSSALRCSPGCDVMQNGTGGEFWFHHSRVLCWAPCCFLFQDRIWWPTTSGFSRRAIYLRGVVQNMEWIE